MNEMRKRAFRVIWQHYEHLGYVDALDSVEFQRAWSDFNAQDPEDGNPYGETIQGWLLRWIRTNAQSSGPYSKSNFGRRGSK
jgi:hypothetical protein